MLSKNMYESILVQAGLTEKQAKVYLACLELNMAKVPEISRKANIKRTTTYGIIDELVKMEILNSVVKNKSKLFQAQSPALLLDILDKRREALKKSLPELENVFSTHHIHPKVTFFEGKSGIKQIYQDGLNCISKKIYQVVKAKSHSELLGEDFVEEYIKERIKRGITAYDLHPKSGDIYTEKRGRQNINLKRYVRYLPPDLFSASMIMVYDNKVAMISSKKENFGFIIESKEFSNTLKGFFDFMWKLGSTEPDII